MPSTLVQPGDWHGSVGAAGASETVCAGEGKRLALPAPSPPSLGGVFTLVLVGSSCGCSAASRCGAASPAGAGSAIWGEARGRRHARSLNTGEHHSNAETARFASRVTRRAKARAAHAWRALRPDRPLPARRRRLQARAAASMPLHGVASAGAPCRVATTAHPQASTSGRRCRPAPRPPSCPAPASGAHTAASLSTRPRLTAVRARSAAMRTLVRQPSAETEQAQVAGGNVRPAEISDPLLSQLYRTAGRTKSWGFRRALFRSYTRATMLGVLYSASRAVLHEFSQQPAAAPRRAGRYATTSSSLRDHGPLVV